MKNYIKKAGDSGTFSRVILPIILIIIVAIIGFSSSGKVGGKQISIDRAQIVADDFINSYLMNPGTRAKILSVVRAGDLFKLEVDIGDGEVIESYLSKDGKLFFAQAFNIEETKQMYGSDLDDDFMANIPATEAPKTERPNVELFVMSHCPYGTQIEKGILPVAEALKDHIDFNVKFVDYAMHGKIELDEQLVQYCIQEEQNDKYLSYLDCFLDDGDTETCLNNNNINKSALNACIDKADKEFKVTENYENNVGYKGTFPGFDTHKADNLKYGVAGSPTLIINETEIQSGRDSNSLLSVICNSFIEAPDICSSLSLSTINPDPGFRN